MLVLSRKEGESIHIGPDVKITVVRIGPHTVRLGIEAPKTTSVHRQEVFLQIQEEKKKEDENLAAG